MVNVEAKSQVTIHICSMQPPAGLGSFGRLSRFDMERLAKEAQFDFKAEHLCGNFHANY